MSKYKRIDHEINKINAEKSTDEYLFKIINTILNDDDLKKVSGIGRNSFAVQTRDYYKKHKRFSDKQRSALIRTLGVYKDNLGNANLL